MHENIVSAPNYLNNKTCAKNLIYRPLWLNRQPLRISSWSTVHCRNVESWNKWLLYSCGLSRSLAYLLYKFILLLIVHTKTICYTNGVPCVHVFISQRWCVVHFHERRTWVHDCAISGYSYQRCQLNTGSPWRQMLEWKCDRIRIANTCFCIIFSIFCSWSIDIPQR